MSLTTTSINIYAKVISTKVVRINARHNENELSSGIIQFWTQLRVAIKRQNISLHHSEKNSEFIFKKHEKISIICTYHL